MMNTGREAIETWLLLDGCQLPPRVFAIIEALLDVIERQDQQLAHYRDRHSNAYPDSEGVSRSDATMRGRSVDRARSSDDLQRGS